MLTGAYKFMRVCGSVLGRYHIAVVRALLTFQRFHLVAYAEGFGGSNPIKDIFSEHKI